MTTPILTKSQQRKSLSAKKGPIKGLKNILAQPNDNYWPILKDDSGATLENLLKRLLPILKRLGNKILWSKLRKMTKQERLAARKANQIESNTDYNETLRKFIVFGINAVTRLLEKDNACCILVESTVNPSLLVKHIVVMAQQKNVPILLISFLKDVTLQSVGFSSAAIGLKKDVKNSVENHFWILFEKISEISSNISNLKTSVSLFQNKISIDEKNNEQCFNTIKGSQVQIDESDMVSSELYLYRTSTKRRIFEPPCSTKENEKMGIAMDDFIALGDDKLFDDRCNKSQRFFEHAKQTNNNHNTESKLHCKNAKKLMDDSNKAAMKSNKTKVNYKPLKVKRLQGNEFRTKATKPSRVKKK